MYILKELDVLYRLVYRILSFCQLVIGKLVFYREVQNINIENYYFGLFLNFANLLYANFSDLHV